jgi:hypothetical protein
MGAGAAIAGVGAVGSLASGAMQSSAASSAAGKQTAAAQQANQEVITDLAPFTNGAQASGDLSNYFNFETPASGIISQWLGNEQAATPQAMTEANLVKTPGYQFDLTQGLQSVQSANAAKGLGVSGAALKDAATYATGLADNTYQNQFGIEQQQYADTANNTNQVMGGLNEEFNMLASPVTTSQNSAAQTATNTAQTTMAAGNAAAAGIVGGANALSGGFSGASNAASSGVTNYMLAQALQNNGSANMGSAVGDQMGTGSY